MSQEKGEILQILIDDVGLTPYEARAYVAILHNGPLSPTGVNQKSGIPRPRTYDALNSLVGKGLLVEQPGKPSKYLAVDPQIGLMKLMEGFEKEISRQLEKQRDAVKSLVSVLSESYANVGDKKLDDDIVWVTRKDSALVAKYSEAIRNLKDELIMVTALETPPDKEILRAVKDALKRKITSRVIRPITSGWSLKDIKQYLELITLGDDIRQLDYDGLSFAIFDRKEIVLWLPPHPSRATIWIRLPLLAEVLLDHFDSLWEKGEPAQPMLEKLAAAKKE